jgi:sugar lactone lactonase YvrE
MTPLIDGLAFPEGPRWHQGRLWFSDMHAHTVMAVDLDGRLDTIVEVAGRPSGLGWLPDGRLLVVSMLDRLLLRLDERGLTVVADLSALASSHCNDMVVDAHGNAYIGNFGFDFLDPSQTPKTGEIVLVRPDGQARVVADDLGFPNGSVITPDGATLIVAESAAARLTAFTIEPDGSLSGRRVFAAFDDRGFSAEDGRVDPDGICLDADGGVWVAAPTAGEVLRVVDGGRITHRLRGPSPPYACMLGGPRRTTLFVLQADSHVPADCAASRRGRIDCLEVVEPGVGWP